MADAICAALVTLELACVTAGFAAMAVALASRLLLLQSIDRASRLLFKGACLSAGGMAVLMMTTLANGRLGASGPITHQLTAWLGTVGVG